MTKRNKTMGDTLPDELISTLTDAVIPATPPDARASELKARVMARIQGKKSFDILTVKSGEGEWITVLPGVQKKILSEDRSNNIQSYLLKMAPGAIIPEHQHLGDEEGFMLEGDVNFGDFHLSAGDYLFAPKGSIHEQATSINGCTVFLRAYVDFD